MKKKSKSKPALKVSDSEALRYHEFSTTQFNERQPGKIEVVPTKACMTQRDLSLAYTPGVAAASLAIAKDPRKAADYTSRSNLVAVVSNGTAVLGLGDIGPLAAKPVMEGKAVLFKKFANINVFDIELNAPNPADVIRACEMLEPTVAGINLEDIKSPECFEIEEALKKSLKIPVFHDDQHGTAIIVCAAFINALKLAKKKPAEVRLVFSGAGAAAIACARLLLKFGVQKKNIVLCDKEGIVHSNRKGLDPFKSEFAQSGIKGSLAQALKGADVFIGLSVGGIVKANMLKGMKKNPIIFALANPTPEIGYHEAKNARPDALVATGRSDFPNQINNVLGFPYIFRGALDVESSAINDEMKIAAAKALARLAEEEVPESVSNAYEEDHFHFGPDYLIPKPFDLRALYWVAPAVAEAAMKSGVSKRKINLKEYRENLKNSIDRSRQILGASILKAKEKRKKIVFPEGDLPKIIRAAQILVEDRIATPILLGAPQTIKNQAEEIRVSLNGIEIIDPNRDPRQKIFAEEFYRLRQRKGMSRYEAQKLMERRTHFGLMLVESGEAHGLVSGLGKSYPETIRPTLQIIGLKNKYRFAAGLYVLSIKDRVFFFADTTVNVNPTSECLAEIALQAAERVQQFGVEPRIAMLSFSNFGSAVTEENKKIVEAIKLIRHRKPKLIIDGEMQADTAVTGEILARYPFSELKTPANVLVFPNLAAGNIAYKLLQRLAGADVIGPILLGAKKPVHVLQQGSSVDEIVNMATIAAADANELNDPDEKS
jgi:malate dehydrogenase (oxaloacetate-decarboxylating)(NADP+)